MPHRLKIVVGGYIVGYPLGGMTWHHLHYLLGFQQLGHDVFFLEDTGGYGMPYDPTTRTCSPDPTYGLAYLAETLQSVGLPVQNYCFYSDHYERCFGLSDLKLLESADLLLCVSGVTPLRPGRPRPRRTCVIDTDPGYTQLRMRHDAAFLDYFRSFDAVATFGPLIGTAGSAVPAHGLNWIPTRQPIALNHWPVSPVSGSQFTTVGSWSQSADRDQGFDGRSLGSSKADAWEAVIDVPAHTRWELGIAATGIPAGTAARFTDHRWHLTPGERVSRSAHSYRQFIQNSAGEFTVAKPIYTQLPTGWFSDRSAAYLASGRPVVTQSSGFESWLPVGEGLFSFTTPDEAAAALEAVDADYDRHCRAARRLAERHFSAERVLKELLDTVM